MHIFFIKTHENNKLVLYFEIIYAMNDSLKFTLKKGSKNNLKRFFSSMLC